MGLPFFEDHGGREVYSCKTCQVYLTHDCFFLSSAFNGTHGPAVLFSNVTNVTFGPTENRRMLTGAHKVRDIRCRGCRKVLGWYYEFADCPQQQYKERCFILEKALFDKTVRSDEECFHA